MGNLFGSVLSSARTLRVLERQMAVVQNNVSNASTPGYARQIQTVWADHFSPSQGLSGGVRAGDLVSTRNQYAEQAVRHQQHAKGFASQQVATLQHLELSLPVHEQGGIPAALTNFFERVSVLAVSPASTPARQAVIDSADSLAGAFRAAAASLLTQIYDAERQIRATADHVNRLGEQIRQLNEERRNSFQAARESGLDARLHTALEELAALSEYTAIDQPDGTVSVYLGGQIPLVLGNHGYEVSAAFPPGRAQVLDHAGNDVTTILNKGRLGALLQARNETLAGLATDLNRLAQAVADRVNTQLAAGVDSHGNPPTVNLFSYHAAGDAAQTLTITGITASQIAAATAAAPGGNGNALALGELARAPLIDNLTFTAFYGHLAGRTGRMLTDARAADQAAAQLLAQARLLRQEISGVSLDIEAAHLIELQRSYEATGKLVAVLNSLTETLLNIVR